MAGNVFPDVDWAAGTPEELLMGSTVDQRGQAAGELMGQNQVLASLDVEQAAALLKKKA